MKRIRKNTGGHFTFKPINTSLKSKQDLNNNEEKDVTPDKIQKLGEQFKNKAQELKNQDTSNNDKQEMAEK